MESSTQIHRRDVTEVRSGEYIMCVHCKVHSIHYSIYMQIPLGVLPKDENKLEDMVCILEHLHGYVPTVEQQRTIEDTLTGETNVVKDQLYSIE